MKRIEQALTHLFLLVGGGIMILPLAWMILSSLKPDDEIRAMPPVWIPRSFEWHNYVDAWNTAPMGRFFLNTLFVAGVSTIGILLTSALAGYAFSHMRFRGQRLVFLLLIATLAIPFEVTMIPSFLVMRDLGWIDTYYALIVPSLASVFGIFLLRQSFGAVPRDLLEAAQLDGCSHFRYLFQVVVPLSRASLASLGLFAFLAQWNSYLWPLLVTNRQEIRTVQTGLRYFMSTDLGNQWGPLMAAATMVVVPTLVVFFIAQRHLVEGFASAGLKG